MVMYPKIWWQRSSFACTNARLSPVTFFIPQKLSRNARVAHLHNTSAKMRFFAICLTAVLVTPSIALPKDYGLYHTRTQTILCS